MNNTIIKAVKGNTMKKALLIIVILSFCISCKKDNPTVPVVEPHISFITPSTALIGYTVSIIGSNFGSSKDSNSVSINEIIVSQYISWSDTLIKITVPVGASTGKLYLKVNDLKSNEINITLGVTINYEMIKIGSQIWMLRNLDVDHYRNGDPIPEVKDPNDWLKLKTGAWCYFYNDSSFGITYGKLYNWYAVNDPRGLAPEGWHIPSDIEWTTLSSYLGGSSVAGGKLKNESGFSALLGGYRHSDGIFDYIAYSGNWWSSTESGTMVLPYYPWYRYIYSYNAEICRYKTYAGFGFSVRCIKDN